MVLFQNSDIIFPSFKTKTPFNQVPTCFKRAERSFIHGSLSGSKICPLRTYFPTWGKFRLVSGIPRQNSASFLTADTLLIFSSEPRLMSHRKAETVVQQRWAGNSEGPAPPSQESRDSRSAVLGRQFRRPSPSITGKQRQSLSGAGQLIQKAQPLHHRKAETVAQQCWAGNSEAPAPPSWTSNPT